jgi:hypothetical protein
MIFTLTTTCTFKSLNFVFGLKQHTNKVIYIEGRFAHYGFECVISVVYALNNDNSLKKDLWNHFVEVKANITKP